MKKLLLGITALGALGLGNAAFAADMRVKAPIMAPVVFSWSGCYVGGNVGWKGGLDTIDTFPSGAFLTVIPAIPAAQLAARTTTGQQPHGSGVDGGGQVGCNYQSANNFVVGVEGDLQWTTLKETSVVTLPPLLPFVGHTQTVEKRFNWFSTLRGRAGFSWDRALLYGTGGLAIGHFGSSFNSLAANGDVFSGSDAWTNVGWVIGAGIEVALWTKWSIKAEYLYMDFGNHSFASPFRGNVIAGTIGDPTFTYTASEKLREQNVRIGLNYKWDWAPVVARY